MLIVSVLQQLLLCDLDLRRTGTVIGEPCGRAATGTTAQGHFAKLLNYYFQWLQDGVEVTKHKVEVVLVIMCKNLVLGEGQVPALVLVPVHDSLVRKS